MAYIAAEDILKAKEMDLMTYLRNYEPQELVHVSGNTYCTREHELSDLEALIRKVVSDEFEKRRLNPSSFEVESNPENENTILDFLDSF